MKDFSAQTSLGDEVAVDLFAGGGGASTGFEIATGRIVDIAVNHDPAAILLHKTNHPYTEHFTENVWHVDPIKVCRGRPVGFLWASPDCKHFSRASGKALKSRKIRGLAWVVLRWAGTVRPRVIIIENVPEFLTWGPVRRGRPVKAKAGTTFQKWHDQLTALGYAVEWRELTASDYDTPTSRTRLLIVARCDGQPIVWPEKTNGAPDSEAVKSGRLKPWRTAAEIIDWSLPTYSIFESKEQIKERYGAKVVRPLADNTMKRVARGLDKFVIKSGKPFMVPSGYGERAGQAPRIHDIDAPVPTVVGTGKHYLCEPRLSPYVMCNNGNNTGAAVGEPVPTVTTGRRNFLACASLVQYHDRDDAQYSLERPLLTVDGSNRYALQTVYLTQYYGNADAGQAADTPLYTVTTKDREGLACAYMAYFKGKYKGQPVTVPLRTITAGDGQFGEVMVSLAKADGRDLKHWPEIRDLLNRHCGYNLAQDDIILFLIDGAWKFINDLGLRMLAPKELYAAMGFPIDYQFERDYQGNSYPRSQQVAKCGNAVCPPLATAMIRANMPEWCSAVFYTMADILANVAM